MSPEEKNALLDMAKDIEGKAQELEALNDKMNELLGDMDSLSCRFNIKTRKALGRAFLSDCGVEYSDGHLVQERIARAIDYLFTI